MLKIKNLHVSVGEKKILKGVEVEVKPGEIKVIMGPNGSGKSTLAQAIMGHPGYSIDRGRIEVDNKNVVDLTPDARAKSGLFLGFQSPVGVEGVSAEQILRKVARPEGVSALDFRKDLEKKCKRLGLKKELIRRSINQGFSGGEKKKMEALQMEVMDLKYVVLDEVDSGLDIDGVKMVAKSIERVVKGGVGVLLITHYRRILRYLDFSNINIMIDGKIKVSGKRELLTKLERKGYGQFII